MDWLQFAVTIITTLAPVALGYLQLRSQIEALRAENKHLREENENLQNRVDALEVENKDLYERLLKRIPGDKL